MSDDFFAPQQPNMQNPATNPDLPKITGNIPPELAAMMNQKPQQNTGNVPPQNAMPQNVPQQQPKLPATAFMPPGAVNNTNPALTAILEQLKSHSAQYEEVVLPSLGKFYDGTDGPADGKLHIKPMTGEEEQILATPRFVKKGQAINMIFSKCIKENFKVQNLLTADRTFLLIYLRGISYGTEYEVEVKDPDSDRKFSTVIDLDSLHVTRCPADYGPTLSEILPKTNLKVFYRLSKGKDETELQEHRERRLKFTGDGGTDDSLLFRTAQLVESIEGITDKNEILTVLRNLPIQDLSFLRNVVNDPPFGVDTKVTIVSPVSSEEFEIELPLEANFFFPRNKKRDPNQV